MALPSDFDLIVVGSGTAGTGIATRCARRGWRVALAEAREPGGTCALRGCEPKKVFWTLADAMERAQRLAPHGVAGGEALRLDWGAAQAFKHSFTDPVPGNRAAALREAGVTLLEGTGRFLAPDLIGVGTARLRARHVVIATGAVPAPLPIEGADLLATSDDVLDWPAVPRRLILLGGGYISFEIAHLTRRAGAEVTILQEDDRPLSAFDAELVDRLVAWTRTLGIDVRMNCRAEAILRRGAGYAVRAAGGETFEADAVVHGLGRVPALAGLDLEAGGVPVEKGRLQLDEVLRSVGNPRVFAAGDAAQRGPALTPVASEDARAVAATLLEGEGHRPDHSLVPSAVFTLPPLAMVGLTEAAARQQGLAYEVRRGDMAAYQSVRRTGEAAAAFKLLVEPGGQGRLLGAHLLGPEAPEVINLAALAMRAGTPVTELRHMMTAYPSAGSNLASMLG